MPGRVLNFPEFFNKYSSENTEPLSVDAISNASANFEEGFDDTTYDQPELGPKRPVSGNYEATPSFDETTFSQTNSAELNAPEEAEEPSEEEVEQIEKSALLACDFIYDNLLPLLEEFENDNDDPDYIPGIATHGLFVALIQELADLGYTQKDLNKEIKTYMNTSLGEVVH